jgi:site-specific recombinase XerD
MPMPKYTVVCRHSATCIDKAKGRDYTKCNCRKHIAVYDPNLPLGEKTQGDIKFWNRQALIPTKTRVWTEAEQIAQAYRDKHDPAKVQAAKLEAKLKAREAEEQSQSVTIEKAVSAFLIWKSDNPSRRSSKLSGKTSDSAMGGYQTLLGNVQNGEVLRKGHLFTWLEKQNPRPVLISDLTPVLVDAFRASWRMNDLTTTKNFTRLKAFFDYSADRGGWIEKNPMDGLRQPSVQDGSRTMAFSTEQYQAILDKLAERPQTADNKRLLTLVELMRWSGMAIHDAVNFNQSTMVGNELRYRRQKTNVLAKPTLVSHVVELLRTVVPINGDPDQPFRNVSRSIDSDKDYWRLQIKELFSDAGLQTIKTDVGIRSAHPHMLRDTFAVGQLRTQYDLGQVNLQTIADALGDSIATFTKHYKPQIDELEQAHKAAQNAIVEAQEAKLAKKEEEGVLSIRGRK